MCGRWSCGLDVDAPSHGIVATADTPVDDAKEEYQATELMRLDLRARNPLNLEFSWTAA